MGISINRIGRHLAFWVFFMVVYYKIWETAEGVDHYWFYMALMMPIELVAIYFTAYYLLPRFLLKKRFLAFGVSILLSAAFFITLERAIQYYIFLPANYPEALNNPFFYLPSFWNIGMTLYAFVFLFSGVRLYQSLTLEQQKQTEMEKQSLQSELALLRSQINPHFLFNTLNNIDQLVFKNQHKASDSIVKLSEIMRYMLYEANTDYVPLEREVQYLQSMIDLMRLRVKNPRFILFEVKGEPGGKLIPPMLLVPFVENAFKHGKKSGDIPGIKIHLNIGESAYEFEVENKADTVQNQQKDKTGGIGLNNVKRRLALLYQEDYLLEIHSQKESFKTLLRIPTKKSV